MSEIQVGLARIHAEPGERRDFLPAFVASLEQWGARLVLEKGYSSGMGLSEQDYCVLAPAVRFAEPAEIYNCTGPDPGRFRKR